jgi:dimethylamine/trimethylamine dehydrogenase
MTDEHWQSQTRLLELEVDIIASHGLVEFDGSSALLKCTYTGRTHNVGADAIVQVTARTPTDELYKEIVATIASGAPEPAPTVRKIGDCDAPAIIAAAVYAGHKYARELGTDSSQETAVRQDRLFDQD